MTKYPSQSDFARDKFYVSLSSGIHEISYTDSTHIEPNDWRDILSIDIKAPTKKSANRECSFGIKLSLDAKFESGEKGKEKYPAIIEDALSLCAVRLGLIAPLIVGKTS
jgi:hypothetical protein